MKLLVVGFGQCGCNIADGFARMNRRARSERRIEIVTGAYAVNTDIGDLGGLSYIKADIDHRILMGGNRVGGHGVGKINEMGAEIAREDADKDIDAIRKAPHLFESDAFLLIAGAAGGTGSGALPVMAQVIRERYVEKPIYSLIVLPFEHEERNEERAVYNSATCLKSAKMVSDAVFLVDNERYASKNSALRSNRDQINAMVVRAFYDILCAGEEKKAKYLGVRLLDAGDVIQTVAGWTAIGRGRSQLSALRPPFGMTRNFRQKDRETHKGTEAMDQALGELSFECEPAQASRALYLVSAPAKDLSLAVIQQTGDHLRSLAPESIIRNGDYPRGKDAFDVSLVLSELKHVGKVQRYYAEASTILSKMKQRREQTESAVDQIDELAEAIPSLF